MEMARAFHDLVTGETDEPPSKLGDLQLMRGVRKFPQRVKCAMLAWRALEQALAPKRRRSASFNGRRLRRSIPSLRRTKAIARTKPAESLIASEDAKRPPINCCEEPFRLFFPIGALLGVLGVSLWPLFYGGVLVTYPSVAHARLMIEGFMASFVIGFLGTAGPRITSAPHFSRNEVVALFTLDLLAAGLHFGGSNRAGDFVFVVLLAVFVFVIGKRFVQRVRFASTEFCARYARPFEWPDRSIAAGSFRRPTLFPALSHWREFARTGFGAFCRFLVSVHSSSHACSIFRERMSCLKVALCRRDGFGTRLSRL